MVRLVVLACLVATAAALPTVPLVAESYAADVASSDVPWLIEVYSGMCESCKAYDAVWHSLETKLEKLDGIGLGRINMDDTAGSALANRFFDLLNNGIPVVLWVEEPKKRKFGYEVVDDGTATDGKQLWNKLKKVAPKAKEIVTEAAKKKKAVL